MRLLHTFLPAAIAALALTPTLASAAEMSDGIITVSGELPAEIKAGEKFDYDVTVTNSTDNVTLHDIVLSQRETAGLTIEEAKMEGGGAEQDSVSKDTFEIATLKPGESETVTVTATADQEGDLRTCLQIESYKKAICLTAKVVKPELELTKTAPEKVNGCEMITLTYTVKNGGTGDVGAFTVSDPLGSDLQTIEGNKELKFNVDGLAAGDTRKFQARVFAVNAGEYSSRAEAAATDSDLSARSAETTTTVVLPQLSAKVEGPDRLYGGKLATYTAMITNTGNAVANDVDVTISYPEGTSVADMSQPTMSMDAAPQAAQGQPTPAKRDSDEPKMEEKKDTGMAMATKSMKIDALEPGQTAKFTYAIRPGDADEVKTSVVALFICDVAQADAGGKSKTEARATAMVSTKVVRLPATQLEVVDDEDPVEGGSNVVYTINIINEGDAIDNKVELSAKLPEGLEYVSADGPTEVTNEGQNVTFAPIETIGIGEEVVYTVTGKATGEGDLRFEVKLNTEGLDSEVIEEEPTRVLK